MRGIVTSIGLSILFLVLISQIYTGWCDITEDPFTYGGEHKLDESELTDAQRNALPHVMKYADEYGLSPALIMAIIEQESSFNPNAVGDNGKAIGYMQVHYPAAIDAGYTGTEEQWAQDGLDPDTNIKYGAKYVTIQKDRWGNSDVYNDELKNTVSAYNAGHPTKDNEGTYVNPVLAKYSNYKNKYADLVATIEGGGPSYREADQSIKIPIPTRGKNTSFFKIKIYTSEENVKITGFREVWNLVPASSQKEFL